LLKCLVVADDGLTVEVEELSGGRKGGFGADIAFEVGDGEVKANLEGDDFLIKTMALGRDVDIYMRPAGRASSVWDRSKESLSQDGRTE